MPEVSVGAAIAAGFALIRQRPLTVWVWGLVNFALVALALLVVGSAVAPLLGGGFNPESFGRNPAQMLGMLFQIQGAQLLLALGRLVVQAVVMAAVFRAVLRPEQSQWAYMRLGAAELFLVFLTFGEGLVLGFGLVIVMLPLMMVIMALAFSKAIAAAIVIGVVGFLLILGVALYFGLRFALAGPMTVADNQFRLMESWQMTKGHVGALFQTGLLMMIIFIGIELVVFLVLGAIGLGVVATMAGGFSHLEDFFRRGPAAIFGVVAPIALILGFLGSFVVGCFYAIAGAPWAEIYRQLAPPDPKAFA